MTRPQIIDTFMYNEEADMLACRLTEMYDAVDWFIVVEADVDHQNHPKPYNYDPTRFTKWADKIIVVQATGLPDTPHAENPWAREHAQREWVKKGLAQVPRLKAEDIVLHGDVDEIVRPLYVRNVRPQTGEVVAFHQRLHCFAVDWLHPDPWRGTVAATVATIYAIEQWVTKNLIGCGPFAMLRDLRNGIYNPNVLPPVKYKVLPDAGWHLSWMGGRDVALKKLGSFCHPEIADRTLVNLEADRFNTEGFHVDGRRMTGVAVTDDWPRYIVEGSCPANWFRTATATKPGFREEWFHQPSQDALARLARQAPPGLIIEIGSWEGRSTIALANAVHPRTVEAVDTWAGSPGEISADLAQQRDVYKQWQINVDHWTAGNVRPHRMGWRDYLPAVTEPIGFAFIDAEHSYQEVFDNIKAILPHLAPGAILCGDDQHHPPIRQALADLFDPADITFDASLWIWRNPGDRLEQMYRDRCRSPSDIVNHLPRFVELVTLKNAQHVIELGSRTGVSTVAWLYALQQTGGHLTTVDLSPAPEIGTWSHWEHIQGDDTDPYITERFDPADIIFIDSSHALQHTRDELRIYLPKLKPGGLFVLHDTELPRPEDSPESDGLYPVKRAIEEFVTEHNIEWLNFPDCWGLGILKAG